MKKCEISLNMLYIVDSLKQTAFALMTALQILGPLLASFLPWSTEMVFTSLVYLVKNDL